MQAGRKASRQLDLSLRKDHLITGVLINLWDTLRERRAEYARIKRLETPKAA